MIFKTYKTFRFKAITPTEICSLIKKLKKKKSAGCDNLPVVFLKDAKDAITEPLTYIINLFCFFVESISSRDLLVTLLVRE